ncbi:hypothetical protein [Actinoplanes campanulatus]|uniref:hypothetical protein n=1 Tax=Actinoplanes campanulatus TaxID=113559 RepID=UPI001953D554|nr:hypothetical protein [Actinoplanes capillaceus]
MSDIPNGGRRQAVPRQTMESPKQVTLQFLDDTWERLLNSLERLEQVSEAYRNLTATRLDQHPDRDRITESELDVRWEVHLQIKSLERIVKPVVEDAQWMIDDFLRWFGGRARRPIAVTDEYAVPVLHCVMDHPYELPDLDEVVPTETDILDAAEALGRGLHESDKIEERFLADSRLEATRHLHTRARSRSSGLVRLSELNRNLAVHLAYLIDHPQPAKEEPR